MIAVIADDLSGAAEIGGIARQAGLSVDIGLDAPRAVEADVLIVETDSRSLGNSEAALRVRAAVEGLAGLPIEWLYKKIDSVLRGPVLAEARSLLESCHRDRAVMIPANPTRKRVIEDGVYLIGNRPLATTPFAEDPEHPARSSRVLELLGSDAARDCHLLSRPETVLRRGITIPEVSSTEELRAWARRTGNGVLPIGAAEFFRAVLEARGRPGTASGQLSLAFVRPTLFVCGSLTAWQTSRRLDCQAQKIPVTRISSDESPGAAARRARQQLDIQGSCMLALKQIDPGRTVRQNLEPLVETVVRVLEHGPLERICLEGGATAAAVVRRLGWAPLRVRGQYANGVVSLQSSTTPELIVKPGSYNWPAGIWPEQVSRLG